ncbi:1,4-dihydroxy-2-naphthoyl-CoA thioesterase 1-like [Dioscorea cayenensis subsp. rotundata]|uniref:1,4-dihydroxy-2-naphthoyl-CoA thioesterase 1-like n=1 Tax=Dioscorea cayennensis subsp. rotundata TaxID=55577 RepID=A0AB40AXP0_DIOCR|nr:1,4-dihydroxy-2-naphthoyl-CoA thioesterase 1-like [Dioscorea cayenensis subsp. rotundata]
MGELSGPPSTEELDAPLHLIGFEIIEVSAKRVNGRLKITDSCCQPFKVLHGGVSALISEALASIGAHVASGFMRIAGIQLSINHHRPARSGDLIFAEATPVHPGKTIQVWEVHIWKLDPSTLEKGLVLASSKVTFLSNMPVPDNAREAGEKLKKFAKL